MAKTVSHSVPGSIAGVIFQFERALLHLAKWGAGALVGIETCDDVAVEAGGQFIIWEQDKHSIRKTGHPLQDRSKNLWNTLDIWLQKLATYPGATDHIELYLVTNRSVPACLARSISDAQDEKSIADCLKRLRKAGTSDQEEIQALMSRVLVYSDAELKQVIKKCTLFDATHPATAGATREQLVKALELPQEVCEQTVCDSLAGWLQETAMAEWRVGRPAWISFDKFNRRKFSLIFKLRTDRVREFPPNRIFWTPAQAEEARVRNFVAHLANVNAKEEQLTEAVLDYLRFSTEYSRLLESAEVDRSEWELFFDDLRRRWKTISLKAAIDHSHLAPDNRGLRILIETTDPTFRADLGGQPTTYSYLTSGGYHRLADGDQVWWHPNYKPKGENGEE